MLPVSLPSQRVKDLNNKKIGFLKVRPLFYPNVSQRWKNRTQHTHKVDLYCSYRCVLQTAIHTHKVDLSSIVAIALLPSFSRALAKTGRKRRVGSFNSHGTSYIRRCRCLQNTLMQTLNNMRETSWDLQRVNCWFFCRVWDGELVFARENREDVQINESCHCQKPRCTIVVRMGRRTNQ